MIFDSLGVGEMGVVLALAVLLVEPKKLGKVMRSFGQFKRKVSQIQADIKSQLDAIVVEEDARENRAKIQDDKTSLRKWGKEQAQAIPATARAEASSTILKTLIEWPSYKNAKVVSCFVGLLDEVDTEPVLQKILADGKTLLVPYIVAAPTASNPADAPDVGKPAAAEKTAAVDNGSKHMAMAVVTNLAADLSEGAYGILEPCEAVRPKAGEETGENPVPKPDLILVPGTCFDLRGGRLGKGLGFYDKYLVGLKSLRVGLCYDVQISGKNLALDPHDQMMDAVISEKRLLVFSAPRGADA